MSTLLQIILINLAVSCDNVGVIALATRGLEQEKARMARRLGIGLSLVLKLVFIGITGYLFQVTWLHIRIIGGVMLIYVTWNMLRQSGAGHGREQAAEHTNDSFLFAIASIIAADISMSLDNVIALLSIVSADGEAPGRGDMALIVIGLVACVPLLLWFSGAISRLMERFTLLTYLCAGYLVYIAAGMIFDDETIALFFKSINFTFAEPAALVLGALVVISSMFTGGARGETARRRRRMVLLGSFVVLYAFIQVGVMSYVSTNPVEDGMVLTVEGLYGFAPNGANAVYLLGTSPFLFTLCASLFVGVVMDDPVEKRLSRSGYPGLLGRCMLGVAVMILLELIICTAGLTVTFGFGPISLGMWLTNLALQLLLHCTYVSAFCMLRTFVRGRVATVALSMLLVLVETAIVDICMMRRSWLFVASFLPDYYITNLPEQMVSLGLLLRVILIAVLCIGASTVVGYGRYHRGLRRLRPA